MEFLFETEYNAKTMTSMAKALRKTIRRKQNRNTHIFGWLTAALGLFLLIVRGVRFDFRSIITLAAVLVIVIVLFCEDQLNGYAAAKRMLPGTEKAVTVFSEDGFSSTTEVGKSEWKYDKILTIAETGDFFVFIFSTNHAQIYDKKQLRGGTVDEFRNFIEKETKKQVQLIR